MELDFLRQPVIFINEVCDKMSNTNIPDPNEDNRQFPARLWDAAKQRGWKMLLYMYLMQGI